MIAFAVAIGVVGCVAVAAAWHVLLTALRAQVRTAELRVEAMRRHDLAAIEERLAKQERELEALDKSLAFGRKR